MVALALLLIVVGPTAATRVESVITRFLTTNADGRAFATAAAELTDLGGRIEAHVHSNNDDLFTLFESIGKGVNLRS